MKNNYRFTYWKTPPCGNSKKRYESVAGALTDFLNQDQFFSPKTI